MTSAEYYSGYASYKEELRTTTVKTEAYKETCKDPRYFGKRSAVLPRAEHPPPF